MDVPDTRYDLEQLSAGYRDTRCGMYCITA